MPTPRDCPGGLREIVIRLFFQTPSACVGLSAHRLKSRLLLPTMSQSFLLRFGCLSVMTSGIASGSQAGTILPDAMNCLSRQEAANYNFLLSCIVKRLPVHQIH